MRVEPSQLTQSAVPAATPRRHAGIAKAAFGAVLAKASSTAPTAAPDAKHFPGATGQTPAAATPKPATKVPASERYEAVPGHRYEEIVAGPRNGMFINRSGNKRDGEAFVRVERGDRVFHIYGTGKDRLIVGMRVHHAAPGAGTPGTQPAPTASTPAAQTPAVTGGTSHA